LQYSIFYGTGVERDISRLPKHILRRVDQTIVAFADDPRLHSCVKMKGHGQLYRVRIGDWRIVYEVDDARRAVTVQIVAHRSDVYRAL
jgi:mRNA interferase RelE/StbE